MHFLEHDEMNNGVAGGEMHNGANGTDQPMAIG